MVIDRAKRWVYFEILSDKTAQGTCDFLKRLVEACPFRIEKILTDNGKEFTAQGEREPIGRHLFDQACSEQCIEHRLILPGHLQTNGMVEHFNGRVADLLRSTRFQSAAELTTVFDRYLKLYNGQIPQRALDHLCPIQMLKAWREKDPERFNREIYNLTGLDRYRK